jgi:uncharacterized protein
MSNLQLSNSAVRSLLLAVQGLIEPVQRQASPADVLDAIRRMGALQIDTIHVVARSPYFVLWSRLGAYDPRWLDELLAEGQIFEYWAHAACFLPREEYPFFRRRMFSPPADWRDPGPWLAEHADLARLVLERITQEGPLRSADFENPRANPGGWWNWKEEKLALEFLLTAGELMVARRHNFQRLYDLRQRVRPDWDDALMPTEEAVYRHLVLKTVACLGVARAVWIPDYFRLPKARVLPLVEELAGQGALLPVELEGGEPAYIIPEHLDLACQAAAGELTPRRVTLLSPFDPLVWDRTRARQVFGFDYSIECYLPAEKRRYGYFSLPILRRGELVGRLDAKAHRAEGVFEVRSLFLEEGVAEDDGLWSDLAGALGSCAAWHQTPQVRLPEGSPPGFVRAVDRLNLEIG